MSEKLSYKEKVEEFEQEQQTRTLPETTGEEHKVEVKVLSTSETQKNVAEAVAETDKTEQLKDELNAVGVEAQPATMSAAQISRAQKDITKRRSLKKLREQESLPERSLSRIIHQPVIRVLSEGAGKTVSRPSGLLGGGLVAFLGSGSYLVLAKSLHFTYNYSVSLALFVGGFVFGIVLELAVHLATASHRQVD